MQKKMQKRQPPIPGKVGYLLLSSVSGCCMCVCVMIAKITDNNGKHYIGSTVDHKARWRQYKEAGEDMPLHRAIKAQGI